MIDIFVISPYRSDEELVERARVLINEGYVAKLVNAGKLVYSTILSYDRLSTGYGLPKDYSYWQKLCHTMISLSEEVHVLCIDGYEESEGVQDEIITAFELGKVVKYIYPEDL